MKYNNKPNRPIWAVHAWQGGAGARSWFNDCLSTDLWVIMNYYTGDTRTIDSITAALNPNGLDDGIYLDQGARYLRDQGYEASLFSLKAPDLTSLYQYLDQGYPCVAAIYRNSQLAHAVLVVDYDPLYIYIHDPADRYAAPRGKPVSARWFADQIFAGHDYAPLIFARGRYDTREYRVKGNVVFVREKPDVVGGKVLGKVKAGDKIEVQGIVNDKWGYCWGKIVSCSNPLLCGGWIARKLISGTSLI